MIHSVYELANCYDFPYNPNRGDEIIAEERQHSQIKPMIAGLLKLLATGSTNEKVGAIHALSFIDEAKADPLVSAELQKQLTDHTPRFSPPSGYGLGPGRYAYTGRNSRVGA